MTTIVHYNQRAEWLSATYNTSSLILFHVHVVLSSQAAAVRIFRPYVLSRASTWHYIHLHVNPPCDGGSRAIPMVLKGPPMSFFHLVSIHLKLEKAGRLLHTGELPGSPRCPLSVVYSTWFAIKTHVNVIIVPAVEACTVAEMLVRHSVLIRPSSTYVRVTCCLRPSYEVPMAKSPLECPTPAVGWCGHAAYAAHPLASVRHRSWRVTEWRFILVYSPKAAQLMRFLLCYFTTNTWCQNIELVLVRMYFQSLL